MKLLCITWLKRHVTNFVEPVEGNMHKIHFIEFLYQNTQLCPYISSTMWSRLQNCNQILISPIWVYIEHKWLLVNPKFIYLEAQSIGWHENSSCYLHSCYPKTSISCMTIKANSWDEMSGVECSEQSYVGVINEEMMKRLMK